MWGLYLELSQRDRTPGPKSTRRSNARKQLACNVQCSVRFFCIFVLWCRMMFSRHLFFFIQSSMSCISLSITTVMDMKAYKY